MVCSACQLAPHTPQQMHGELVGLLQRFRLIVGEQVASILQDHRQHTWLCKPGLPDCTTFEQLALFKMLSGRAGTVWRTSGLRCQPQAQHAAVQMIRPGPPSTSYPHVWRLVMVALGSAARSESFLLPPTQSTQGPLLCESGARRQPVWPIDRRLV